MRTPARLLILAFCAILGGNLHAQVGQPRSRYEVGGSLGMTNSTVNFSPSIKQDLNLGYTGGLTMRYTSEKYFFLICAAQLEANFVQRGWNELIEDGSGNQYYRTLNYVEIPFLTHLGFGREARGIQGFVNLGPQVGFLINEKEHYGGALPWDTSNRANNVTEQYGKPVEKKLEYGIAGGGGFEIKTGIGSLSFEGRYFYGLSDIFNNTKRDYFGRSANTSIYAKITYMFEL